MADLKLIIANKKYSSWSLRPWIAMKAKGIPFEEVLSQFDLSTMHEHFAEFSPTKKVPVLVHEGMTIWDSLAILEYIAELFPEKGLWPKYCRARAHARCVSNEMHADFPDLRNECPMNMARPPSRIELSEGAKTDIKRVDTIWTECLDTYSGPYLFGQEFTIADAMFAPVVNRIEVYGIPKSPAMAAYCETIKAMPSWQEWATDGRAEPWICENVEV